MNIPEQVGSKYRFILLAGKRVAQLQKGAKPRTEPAPDHNKLTQIAAKELTEGLLDLKVVEDPDAPDQATSDKTGSDA